MSSYSSTYPRANDRASANAPLFYDDEFSNIAVASSHHTQNLALQLVFPVCFLFLIGCLAALGWLAIHGPVQVPGQDTRYTSIAISSGSKIASIMMTFAFARSAWASSMPRVVSGQALTTRSLVAICKSFMSLGQFQSFAALPTSFEIHVLLAAFVLTAMIATSSSFRYDSLPITGEVTAVVADVAFACPSDLVSQTGLFICDQGGSNNNILTNTSVHSWDYIAPVSSGGQNTVFKTGNHDGTELDANVTLAVLPDGWELQDGTLPWMAMSVSCKPRNISVSFTGSGYDTNTSIYLDGEYTDTLDIGNMPQWGSIIQLFPRVNETGPFSSLGYYDVVMLARDEYDGSNMRGVSAESITELGSTWLDLKGYGPVKQGLLGAGANCTFRAETGGQWQQGFWPPLNHTNNTIWGEVVNDRPTLATAMLNYGASWQYTSVSENYLPGGSVSYIANNTGSDIPFADLFTAYIRNQWTLMAYAIPRHTYQTLSQNFVGTGPSKLFISVTFVGIIPTLALLIGALVTLRAWIAVIRHSYWVNRVEFESWWLLKALRSDLYLPGYCNATEDQFDEACSGTRVCYGDVKPQIRVGHLSVYFAGSADMASYPFRMDKAYGTAT
ncbi:hypothetical protein BDZ45DRAFT_729167 [Acephala macrosclerotiorum]|nr:hypothetical protein BDZ45DRAFT_729167 [Acephala macrosclerotiorum]